MKSNGLTFHHPVAFWFGITALVGGVLAHFPMFMHASHNGYRMAGMPMDATMLIGMGMIPVGLLIAAYGLMPRIGALRGKQGANRPLQFHVADSAPLNRAHWGLVVVLVVALAVDVLKPATLGFVIPGMTREYGISNESAGWLALVALIGTTVGSVVWGRIADSMGRRAAILLSALMFIGTAICGAMPSFEWNLAMCFLMGASAGGLLPIAFTLMAETIPVAHRGWLLVALGGVGTSAGYLMAAGAAAWLEPLFSWRALWLLGLPTGFAIVVLHRFIPESPRFLSGAGLESEARAVLAKFSGVVDPPGSAADPAPAGADSGEAAASWRMLRGSHASITLGLIVCGVAWGLVNFGFLLWLPVNLGRMGMDAGAASGLLARSALLALPGILVVIWLYHRWSSIKALVLFIALAAATLVAFFAMGLAGVQSTTAMVAATALLLVSSSGVIAMLLPYASEIYPVHLRGTGAGIVAASSKFGGILGAAFGVLGLFGNFTLSAVLIAIPMALSALMLARSGIETRGQRLEDIQVSLLFRTAPPDGARK
jgi:putative MFS transporter